MPPSSQCFSLKSLPIPSADTLNWTLLKVRNLFQSSNKNERNLFWKKAIKKSIIIDEWYQNYAYSNENSHLNYSNLNVKLTKKKL